jgi:hypothetical protein
LDISNYDNFHGGGGFSHVYVIMHKYFETKYVKNEYIIFYIQLNMFPCVKIPAHFIALGATNSKPSE